MSGKRFLSCCALALFALGGAVQAATLDRLRQDNTIRIAYRRDAPPFSYDDAQGKPAGFIVDLCQAVVRRLSEQVKLPSVSVTYVPVTASNRFEVIQEGKADLLCEATSVTLSRRKAIDFSIDTFVDGAGLLTTKDGPENMHELAGRTVGVLAGTTTEQALRNTLSASGIDANVVPAATHAEGLQMLDSGKVTAYFADRSILWVMQASSKAPDNLRLAEPYLTIEPYALGIQKGDDDFRLEIDRALSGIYSSGEIADIFKRTFGGAVQLSPLLQGLYVLSAIPD